MVLFPIAFSSLAFLSVQTAQIDAPIRSAYTKQEVMIPMRDGERLYTAIYAPKEIKEPLPFVLMRTPYSCAPYGPNSFPGRLGPTTQFAKERFIFVNQDVRGRYMSEGHHRFSPPIHPNKKTVKDVDESTDAYDTIDWLIKNVANNNGKVGIWGISQPGFYASNALIGAHPALKCASPQAPVTDRFVGDDDHHNGAFFLAQRFSFLWGFGWPHPVPSKTYGPGFKWPISDAYRFFLENGSLDNLQKYFKHRNMFWEQIMAHDSYDAYWKPRGMEQHFHNIRPAVLTIGGWFDAEDLFGALHTFKAIEHDKQKQPESEVTPNILVMGPWSHGSWSSEDGDRLGAIEFDQKTSLYVREKVELPFFNAYLKDKMDPKLPKAIVYQTGANQWRHFAQWPPVEAKPAALYFQTDGQLDWKEGKPSMDTYVSDPRRPVPYTSEMGTGVNRTFMVGDQRFAWSRPDVMTYETPTLTKDTTLAGPIQADLYVSTSGTDSDFVVKVIDEYPNDAEMNSKVTPPVRMAGYQMLLRAEIMRAKFRNSLEKPESMVPNRMTHVSFELRDVLHTFKKGHRIMVQVQSSWFPLADLNPQQFEHINFAKNTDFKAATQHIYTGTGHASCIRVQTLENVLPANK